MQIYYDNKVLEATLTATSQNTDFPLRNLQDKSRSIFYRTIGKASERIVADAGVNTGDIFTKLPDVSDLPTGNGNSVTFSSDGIYMAIAHDTAPYITIYKINEGTFTKLANPSSLPTGNALGVSFSSDGIYLAVVHSSNPYITIYKRSGDVFTKLTDPLSLPFEPFDVNFSSDDTYLAVGQNQTPYIIIYKRSGDIFTKLANPASLPPSSVLGVEFSSDVTYLATAHISSPYITIYKRSGDVFTKLSNPASLPTGNGNGISFSSDITYLTIAHDTTPFITIYKRSGDVFTKLPDPLILPTGNGKGLSFSSDGINMAVAHDTTPFITIYKRSGDVFTKLSNPASLPAGVSNGVSFSPENIYLAIAHTNSPFITIYNRPNKFTIDCAALFNYNLSENVVIKLEANEINDWSSPSFSRTLTYRSDSIAESFTEQEYRFVSLLIEDTGNDATFIELGQWFVGTKQQIAYLNPGIDLNKNTYSEAVVTRIGSIRGSKIRNFFEKALNISSITDAKRKEMITMFDNSMNIMPVIILLWEDDLDVYSPVYGIINQNGMPFSKDSLYSLLWKTILNLKEVF